MKKHKWKIEIRSVNQKIDRCVKCDITRRWLWGDYQCWKYYIPEYFYNMIGEKCIEFKYTFKRPDCVDKILPPHSDTD